MIQEDIELSTVNRTSLCEQAEENEDPYSEIRYSQCIEEITSNEPFKTTILCQSFREEVPKKNDLKSLTFPQRQNQDTKRAEQINLSIHC